MENDTQRVIMVIDDKAENLTVLEEILTPQGYKVLTFPRGALAFQALKNTIPDMILLDILIPDSNGYEICSKLKSDPLTENIPVLFMSALDDPHSKVKAFEMGGVDYVMKPFQEAEVIARVKAHMKLKVIQEELTLKNQKSLEQLKWAGEMQRSLLTMRLPQSPLIEFKAMFKGIPNVHCTGNYSDIIQLSETKFLVLQGEVTGQGVRAALVTAILKAVIFPEYIRSSDKENFDPGKFLTWLNTRMNFELRQVSNITICFFAGLIDFNSNSLIYSNAGNTPPFLFKPSGDGKLKGLTASDNPFTPEKSHPYQNHTIHLDKGSILLVFSSGLANSLVNKFIDKKKILDIVKQNSNIHAELLDLACEGVCSEDISLLSARVL